MGRQIKRIVDYFPHDCNHSQNIFILEQRYGNNGYAVFYKLTEILGNTDGHYYDANKPESWEYLLAYLHIKGPLALQILDTLAALSYIDPELWQHKIIWCQDLIDRIRDVYIRRKINLPERPDPRIFNPIINEVNVNNNAVNVNINGISANIMNPPQNSCLPLHYTPPKIKVNESKLNKRILKNPSSETRCSDMAISLANYLKSLILDNNPKAKTPSDISTWAKVIDKMLNLDHRTPDEIRNVIEFSQHDFFWYANILSAATLREKFDQLYLQRERKEKNSAKEKGGLHGKSGRSAFDQQLPVTSQTEAPTAAELRASLE